MFARVHDTLTWHRKTLSVDDAALGVWVRLLAHCAGHLTDGFVPDALALAIASRSPGSLDSLTGAGFLVRRADGYELNNYLEHNAARAEIAAARESAKERKAKSREAALKRLSRVTDAVTDAEPSASVTRESQRPSHVSHAESSASVTRQEEELEEDEERDEEEKGDTSSSRSTPSTSKVDSDDVRKVFEHWRTKLGHERAVLDDKRRRKIVAALKSHGLGVALRAIDGCAESDFHMGRDERSNGKRYDDLELILRNASKIETFAALAPKAVTAQTKSSAAQGDWLDAWPEYVRDAGPKWTPPKSQRGSNHGGT